MYCLDIHIWVTITICIFGVIGNGIAFCTLGKMCYQNASTYLLRALALVDSLYLTIHCIHCYAFYFSDTLLINTFWRKFAAFFLLSPLCRIAHTAAIWTILLVGVHRYIVVCTPLRASRLCTVGNTRKHFLCVLLLSLIINFPQFFEYRIEKVISNHTDPRVTYDVEWSNVGISAWYQIGYHTVFRSVIINYVIPVGSLIFITVRLCQSLRSSRQRNVELSEGQRRNQTSSRTKWMVIVVLIVFLLCHTGQVTHIVHSYFTISSGRVINICKSAWFVLYSLGRSMLLLNSSINVIIYLGFNQNFRKTLCLCVRSVTRRRNNQPPATLTWWAEFADTRP